MRIGDALRGDMGIGDALRNDVGDADTDRDAGADMVRRMIWGGSCSAEVLADLARVGGGKKPEALADRDTGDR